MRCLLLIPIVVIIAATAKADDVIFYWSDKQHNVHATNNIDEVPEPYKAMYRARLKELEEAKKNAPKTPPPQPAYTPPPSAAATQPQASVVDQELAKQKQWRDEVYRWRTELRTATEDLNRIQAQIDQVNFNPVLRMTPQAKAQLDPLEASKQKAIGRIDAAQRMLTQDLPARAKREGVPPRWLE
jgi:hypothetical protein